MSNSSEAADCDRSKPLFRTKASVKVGESFRYTVSYTPSQDKSRSEDDEPCLWVKIKNLESLPLRAAYLAGPYVVYIDITSEDYDQNKPAFSSAEQPVFEPQLKAGQSLRSQLFMNRVKKQYTWIINVVSQIIFSPSTEVQFELIIGRTEAAIHHNISHSSITPSSKSGLIVQHQDTLDLWHSPTPKPNHPLHLVVLTHGLHSNIGADMLYLKDRIDQIARESGENIVVRGYMGNACKTEKGVKYLGKRVANYVLEELCASKPGNTVPSKISFISHSLGGLVQTYAVAHIQSVDPNFFKKIRPVHFICLASPFLGISNENPAYVKLALDFGFVGKTGQDLGLTWKPSPKHKKPLLRILPTGPGHTAMHAFKSRTLYANMMNDGIVPLRTASILYLDWRAISKAERAEKGASRRNSLSDNDPNRNDDIENAGSEKGDGVGEVPEDTGVSSGKAEGIVEKVKNPVDTFNLSSLFSFMAPHAGKKPSKIYRHSQTREDDNEKSDADDTDTILPKKSSVFESGVSVFLPPLPSARFITDPESRPQTIVHDRIYTEDNLPPRRFKQQPKSLVRRLTSPAISSSDIRETSASSSLDSASSDGSASNVVEKGKQEEKIAREWHRDMPWRKVLVVLEPDAHNNIIVRRRFSNAYGWPVIDHLVKEHFSKGQSDLPAAHGEALSGMGIIKGQSNLSSSRVNKNIDLDNERDLSSMIRDLDIDGESSYNSDEESEKSPIDPADYGRRALGERHTKGSSDASQSFSSSGGWESHINGDDDSENDGVVHQVGSIIDNFRGIIGGVNHNTFGAQLLKEHSANDDNNKERESRGPPDSPLDQASYLCN